MTRVAPELSPAADEQVDGAVPASSLSTLPGETALAPSDGDGSRGEIAPAAEVSLQVRASMRLRPPPYPGLACSSQLRVEENDGGAGRASILSSIFTQEDKTGGGGAEGKAGGGDEAGLERGGAMEESATDGGEEVCYMQHPGP